MPRLRARRRRRPADGGALRSLCGRLHNIPVAPPIRRAAEEPPLLDGGAAVARAPPQPADLLGGRRREEVAAARRGARGRERRVVRAVCARGVGRRGRRRARVVAVRRRRRGPAPRVVRRVAGAEGRGDDLDLELLRHGLLPAAQFGVVEGRLLLGGGVAHVPPLGSPPEGQDAAMTGLVVAFAESSKSKTHEFGTSRSGSLRSGQGRSKHRHSALSRTQPARPLEASASRLLLVYGGLPSEV